MMCTVTQKSRMCIDGKIVENDLFIDQSTGRFANIEESDKSKFMEVTPPKKGVVAPGFLELQTNGLLGFHFTHMEGTEKDDSELERIAKYYPSRGVTSFWATIPTVSAENFKKVSYGSFMSCGLFALFRTETLPLSISKSYHLAVLPIKS